MLIIITGLPCTGKTTFGNKLSEKLQIPLISKDALKELMFDYIGIKDREWSKKLGVTSYKQIYYILNTLLKNKNSVIIESNFNPKFDNQVFEGFQRDYKSEIIQVVFKCDGEVLFKRFKKRSESGERHLGHVDNKNDNEFKDLLLSEKLEILDIESKLIEVDTTDFDKVNFEVIIEDIKKLVG